MSVFSLAVLATLLTGLALGLYNKYKLRGLEAAPGGEAGGRLLCSGRHNCSSFVRGGVHLTHGAFLPTNIVKVTIQLWMGLRPISHCMEKGIPK